MTHILLNEVTVDFPVYDGAQRSIKGTLLKLGIGGVISRRGRSQVQVRALEGLTFKLKAGDRLGLVGHNGAGKSTLLRILAGLREPTFGSVEIKGKVAALLTLGSILDPEMTGFENIERAHVLLDLPSRMKPLLIEEVTEFTELGDFLNLPVKIYSAGMQLRLSFALMTSQQPDILLLDETFAAGDAQFQVKARARMTELGKRTDIVVLASHNVSEIAHLCNKVLWLEHGKGRLFGESQTVLEAFAQRK